ncbi:hypothetical protein PFISCL1PPCAC_4285, partial [Pristionchus fissidentatus]
YATIICIGAAKKPHDKEPSAHFYQDFPILVLALIDIFFLYNLKVSFFLYRYMSDKENEASTEETLKTAEPKEE